MKDIYYYKDGTTSERYDDSKILHREDGPAIIIYSSGGTIRTESYSLEGMWHRQDGPALITLNKKGIPVDEDYWLEGESLSKEEHTALMKKINDTNIVLKLLDDRVWVRKLGKEERI